MPRIFGQDLSRRDLLARIGDISQVARIKQYRFVEGPEDGVHALDVSTGSGLTFTVLASRGMDVSSASYNGRPLAWRSSTSDVHPAFFDPEGEDGRGWLRSFYGGLLVTCGLTYAGAAGNDNGRFQGLHGRVSNLPATNVSYETIWDGDEYILRIRGKVRETTVFGENVEMTRTISTRLGAASFQISDAVENLGSKPVEHMMLYHINIGYPCVDDGSHLIAPILQTTPRDENAAVNVSRFASFELPAPDFPEQVFFHQLATDDQGITRCAVVNEAVDVGGPDGPGYGVFCAYDARNLQNFIEWKMMGVGTYVVGMEPANCLVLGRAHERAAGTLQYLEPGEVREYSVEIGVLSGREEIANFKDLTERAIRMRSQPGPQN